MHKIKFLQQGDVLDYINGVNNNFLLKLQSRSSTINTPNYYYDPSATSGGLPLRSKNVPKMTPLAGNLSNGQLDTKPEFDKLNPGGRTNLLNSSNNNSAKFVGAAVGAASAILPEANNSAYTQSLNKGYSALADGVKNIPGYGPIISGFMQAGSAGNKALAKVTGGASTINDPSNKLDEIASSDFLALSVTSLLNAATKTKIAGSDNQLASTIDRGYSATEGLGKTEIGGVTNWLSKNFKGKDLVKTRQNRVKQINTDNALKSMVVTNDTNNQLAANNSFKNVVSKDRQRLLGGYGDYITLASKGSKLFASKLVKKVERKEEIAPRNIIPDGALHARKNNLPEDIAKHVTHKGIPVISVDKGGEITQHAEIERSEIIFHKELTNTLEKLLKQYESGDEKAAIEAGKLLTEEILYNTEDNVNLINTIQ